MIDARRSYSDAHFSIDIGPMHRVVELTLRGMWTLDTCFRCQRTLQAMLDRLPPARPGDRVGLYDLLEFSVQPQPVIAALTTIVTDNVIGSSLNAILTRSALLKSQVGRAAPSYRVFGDRESALVWLMAREQPAAA